MRTCVVRSSATIGHSANGGHANRDPELSVKRLGLNINFVFQWQVRIKQSIGLPGYPSIGELGRRLSRIVKTSQPAQIIDRTNGYLGKAVEGRRLLFCPN